MATLYDYIAAMAGAIASQKSALFTGLLTINPGAEKGPQRAAFSDPSDIDLYVLPEKFHAVVRAYLKAMRSIYVASDLKTSFVHLNELLVCLNRAAESQTNWICPALINCSDELISVYQVREKQFPHESSDVGGVDGSQESPLEVVASTINKAFKVCLTDKLLEPKLSKKQSIHFFLAALLKLYFKLDKLELAKSVEKALAATGHASPTPQNTQVQYRKYAVTYLYYSALLSLNDSDFGAAENKLDTAMVFLRCYKKPAVVAKQTERILMLLVPLKMRSSRVSLARREWKKYPSLKLVYHDHLWPAVRSGNVQQFDFWTAKLLKVFLKRYIYVLMLNLRNLCILRLFEHTHRLFGGLESKTPHIVPFTVFQRALSQSRAESVESVDLGEIECLLANYIHKRQIKGYLSHGNGCIVFSKTEPFPKI
ncbi:hypothetical protein PUMCH_005113 [Australozyma saopauloensis]|uniref:PCI domain-containing protein n=1 Tax=Australozyma saopauloensis TaxID=291208 RepID=A0AAX4HGU3_9ASCO|nr:hypothetical protein PUMCH_005113 [[Candida] saopauloensis]